MNRLTTTLFLILWLGGCSETPGGTSEEPAGGPSILFDESLPFDPDSISVSVELKNDLQQPEVIEDAAVWLYTLGGEFVRLEKAHVAINGTTLSRWDQVEPWYGHSTHYTGDDIPVGDGEVVVSLVLPDQPPVELVRFTPPATVNLNDIQWPEKIVTGQPVTVSWKGIEPLDHLGIPHSTLKKTANEREMFSGMVEPMNIRSKGSMDLLSPIMDRHNRHIEISGREPDEVKLTYVEIEFSTQVKGEVAQGIEGSEASMRLFVSREVRN